VSDPLVRPLLVARAVTVSVIAALSAGGLARLAGDSIPQAVLIAGGTFGTALLVSLAVLAAVRGS